MRLLSLLAPPLCVSCRRPTGVDVLLCPPCTRAVEHLGVAPETIGGLATWAAVSYEGPARAVVRRLKWAGAGRVADQMAATIVANAPRRFLSAPLVAVPSARARSPGFCHAGVLAEAVGRRTGLPVVALLERAGGPRQVGRPRGQRLRNPPRFRALGAASGEFILVDDVVTTGATLGACAAALRDAGCSCTKALAYARTPVR